MPVNDPDRRKELNDAWKQRRYTPAYMKWLYQRRMVPKRQMEVMQQTLERLAAEDLAGQQVRDIARAALDWCDDHERSVGNRFNHEQQRPYHSTEPRSRN